jgi:transcriptional regulator with XRE-family HTH domain
MANGGRTSFGTALRQWRLAAGLTQELLAERSGVGLRSIQGLEREETRPRRETVQRLAEALGLSAEDVAGFDGVGGPQPRRRSAVSLATTGTGSSLIARRAQSS